MVELRLPVGQQAHLAAIVAVAKTRQPRAPVRGADGHHMMDTRVGLHAFEPGPRHQTAHAVTDHERRLPGGVGDAPNRVFKQRYIVVNRAKKRLQVDRHKSMAAALQLPEPRRPQAAIAEKPVDKDHATAAPHPRWRGQLIRASVRAKRLTPAEHLRRSQGFAPPGSQQLTPSGLGCGVGLVHLPEQYEFDSKKH